MKPDASKNRVTAAFMAGILLCASACAAPGGLEEKLPSDPESLPQQTGPSRPESAEATPQPAPSEPDAPWQSATAEPFEFRGFVDIAEVDPRIVIDCRYATENNYTGKKQYPFGLSLLRREAAQRLKNAQDTAAGMGCRLVIFDAYRPLGVQQSLYDAMPDSLKAFVAKPGKNSPHGVGLTVDCGLADLDGNLLEMPSEFDTFDISASVGYTGGTTEQRRHRDLLVTLMQDAGFSVYSAEWWHYSAPNPNGYEASNFSFEDFVDARSAAI